MYLLLKLFFYDFFSVKSKSLYPRSKFEFEQDLPSLYRPARKQRVLTRSYGTVQYVALTRLTYDRGQFSLHSPMQGLTMTTPMVRSDFLQ